LEVSDELSFGYCRAVNHDALEVGLSRLHRQLAELERQVQQTRAEYRNLIALNRSVEPTINALDRLSRQERRVALLVANGHSNGVVAAELHVTIHTVKTQMSSILRKLEVRSRWELERVLGVGPPGVREGDSEANADRLGEEPAVHVMP
jgi:DNA-binding NarL/FixJ family response regulator